MFSYRNSLTTHSGVFSAYMFRQFLSQTRPQTIFLFAIYNFIYTYTMIHVFTASKHKQTIFHSFIRFLSHTDVIRFVFEMDIYFSLLCTGDFSRIFKQMTISICWVRASRVKKTGLYLGNYSTCILVPNEF